MKTEGKEQEKDKSDDDSTSSSSSTSSTSEDEADTKAKQKIEEEKFKLEVDEARDLAEMDAAHKMRYWDFCHGLYPDLSTQDALSPDLEPTKMGEAPRFHPDKVRDFIMISSLQKKERKDKGKRKTEDKTDEGQGKTPKKPRCEKPTRRLRSKSSGVLPSL